MSELFMVNEKNKQTFSPPRVGEVLWRTRPNAMCILTSPVQSVQLTLRFTIKTENYKRDA